MKLITLRVSGRFGVNSYLVTFNRELTMTERRALHADNYFHDYIMYAKDELEILTRVVKYNENG